MQQKPRGREDSVLPGGLLGTILLRGLPWIGFGTRGSLHSHSGPGRSLEACRTADTADPDLHPADPLL